MVSPSSSDCTPSAIRFTSDRESCRSRPRDRHASTLSPLGQNSNELGTSYLEFMGSYISLQSTLITAYAYVSLTLWAVVYVNAWYFKLRIADSNHSGTGARVCEYVPLIETPPPTKYWPPGDPSSLPSSTFAQATFRTSRYHFHYARVLKLTPLTLDFPSCI